MSRRVADLEGAELALWVARALNLPLSCDAFQGEYILVGTGSGDLERFEPHVDWAHGGPLIEQHKITIGA